MLGSVKHLLGAACPEKILDPEEVSGSCCKVRQADSSSGQLFSSLGPNVCTRYQLLVHFSEETATAFLFYIVMFKVSFIQDIPGMFSVNRPQCVSVVI